MASREETPTNSSVSLAASPRAESTPVPNPESSMMELESAQSGKRSKPRASALGASKDSAMQSAGKIRHLKKEDGEPLWRRDIQYDFLVAVFGNEKKVFTNNYEKESEKQNFADLYIDTMARSSKTSKVLRDKLLSDREAAKGMAMVCLLVNLGRMNTTLNCNVPPTIPTPNIERLTWNHSLPRDASSASDIPRHPLIAGSPGCICI